MRSDLVNKVLDAMEIMVKADQDNNNSGSTISATIIEQDSKDKTKYRIQVENEQRFATAMNGAYKKNDEVYVTYPEPGQIGVIIGLKYREGANAVSLITEANYEKLTPNCIILEGESYLFNEEALQQALAPTQDGAARATTILAKFKLNADLEIKESIFYQVAFKIKFIEEDKAREFAFTIDDVHGNPYIQKSSEQFFEIKLPEKLTYSNFESITIEGDIAISDVEIYAAQKLDETGIPSARIYAVNGSTFGKESWQTPFNVPITLKAEMRDEGLIRELSETSCYWFKEDPLITKVDDLGYHSWGGLGWRLLNQTSNGEVNLMSNTLNVSSNTVFRSSVKYKCTIVYNDHHYDADPIEIINTHASLPKLTFYYSEHTTESLLRASVTGTIPVGADVYFRVTAKDAFGKNIENFSKSKLLNAWGPIDRTAINGFNTYTCDLILDFQEGFDEYVETQSIEVKELLRDFGRVVINGKKVYLYNEVGELEENIQPLSAKVYTDNTQTIELPHINEEGKLNYSIKWILPDSENSMIYGSDNGLNEEKLAPLVRNLYEYQYSTSNSIRVEINYLDENEEETGSETTNVEMLFVQQGQAGTNGTQYVCKIGVEETGQSGLSHTIYPNALASGDGNEDFPNLKVVLIRTTDGMLIDIEDKDENIVKTTLRVNENNGETIEENGWPSNYPFKTSYILKANITYNNLVYTAYLPVCYGNIDTNTGFYSVLYNSAGKNPKYRKSSFKDKEGNKLSIETAHPNGLFPSDDDYVYMPPAESIKVGRERVVILSERNDDTFSIPILFYFNRYENAAINSWDGDKVEINNDGNYILAAQGGFGKKDNGSFTGVVLGTRQVDNQVENGIFGYKDGLETFLLNAETGDAKFKGRVEATEGRIGNVNDPNGAYWQIAKDYINSGDLYLIGAKGWSARNSSPIGQMLGKDTDEIAKAVDDVCIRSGIAPKATFALTRGGAIYATEGCIAGWYLNTDRFFKNTTSLWTGNVIQMASDVNSTPGGKSPLRYSCGEQVREITLAITKSIFIDNGGYENDFKLKSFEKEISFNSKNELIQSIGKLNYQISWEGYDEGDSISIQATINPDRQSFHIKAKLIVNDPDNTTAIISSLKIPLTINAHNFHILEDGSLFANAAHIKGNMEFQNCTLLSGGMISSEENDEAFFLEKGKIQCRYIDYSPSIPGAPGKIQYSYTTLTSGGIEFSSSIGGSNPTTTQNARIYLKGIEQQLDGTYVCELNIYAPQLGRLSGQWRTDSGTPIDSDRRLKRNIERLTNNYDLFFDNLMPSRYQIIKLNDKMFHTGFIAQDVEQALIQSGLNLQDFAGLNTSGPYYALGYEEFIALNTDQIQKAKARITTLETENLYLKARLEQLEEKVNQLIGY